MMPRLVDRVVDNASSGTVTSAPPSASPATWTESDPPNVNPQKGFGFIRSDR